MQAKKVKASTLHIEDDPIDYRALERRYEQTYKSAVHSSVTSANTRPLERLISQIQDEEFETNSFLETILLQAQHMLKQWGYTTQLVQSTSQRKIKRGMKQLETQLLDTDNQLHSLEYSIEQLSSQINKYGVLLQEQEHDITKKKESLGVLARQITQYKEVTKNSFDPKEESILAQGELDFHMQEEILEHAKDSAQVLLSIMHEYYAQKSHECALKSVFTGNKLVLSSLYERAELAMHKAKSQNPFLTITKNKLSIIRSYKQADEFLDKENVQRESYNTASSSVPSYKAMADDMMKKRRSLRSIKL